MLSIHCYSSGSSGNLYTVTSSLEINNRDNAMATIETMVMIDPGLPINRVRKLAGFTLPDAVLLTHEHKDHSKAVPALLDLGVDCYMTKGTAAAMDIKSHRCHILEYGGFAHIGLITTWCFETEHDAKEPCGFLLDDGEDRVLYATDTYYLKYCFPGLTKIMIEVNHSYEILRQGIRAGRINKFLANRLMHSHMALETAITFLQANDLSMVREIWLIHLSKENADPERFRKEVEKATGKPVYIAGYD